MHPILIDFGFFELPSYGVLIALAVIVGLWTARRRATTSSLDGDKVVDLGLWVVIWALVGAKLLLILVEPSRYLNDPSQLLGVLRAGGVFLGGFVVAVAAGAMLLRRYKLPPLATLDVLTPSLALAHAIGRIGCLLAGCCWGSECHLPWAITYTDPAAASNVGTPLGVSVHPFPVYASIFNLALYAALELLYRRRPRAGRVFASYLLLYGLGRFFLEYTRGDEARGAVFAGALSTSQGIAVVLVVLACGTHLWISRRKRP